MECLLAGSGITGWMPVAARANRIGKWKLADLNLTDSLALTSAQLAGEGGRPMQCVILARIEMLQQTGAIGRTDPIEFSEVWSRKRFC